MGRQLGHIFDLGHGVLPVTPMETLEQLVEFVQGYIHNESAEATKRHYDNFSLLE